MVNVKTITLEVAYARPDEQVVIPIAAPEGITIEQALALARIQERFPEIDLTTAKVGVFGKLSKLSATPCCGDRIEIYRPLLADPKAMRRQRASEKRVNSKGK